ncbi:MAG: hypothetical protein K2X82_17935 [Gemmataceae bacterium]|nr:hypothetical protein [Gemmataceae bacterium]
MLTYASLLLAVHLAPSAGAPHGTPPRVAPLYDPAVRGDPDRLAGVLENIWKLLPPVPAPEKAEDLKEIARHLIRFGGLKSDRFRGREFAVVGTSGRPVHAMLVQIGLPAVPVLLEQLPVVSEDDEIKARRLNAVQCLIDIYAAGGAGPEVAAARIRAYAAGLRSEEARKQVLSVLESNAFKPAPPPYEGPPKK